MSTTSAPYGLRPIWHPSGIIRPTALAGGIASAYGTAIYTGQPVILNTNGTLTAGTAAADLAGVFAGCQYTPSGGRPTFSPTWPASQAYDANEEMWAFYYSDPSLMYAIQADGSLAKTAVGDQADISNATANGNGYSQATLSTTLAGAGVQAQFRIMQLFSGPDNVWGDTYTQVVVQIARNQFVSNKVAI